ncbi:hypothetical protein FRB91_008921 [Serendipita sp. 411]|nr:hypothetical protein FRB91_008921 [Serendipita sp. 411]
MIDLSSGTIAGLVIVTHPLDSFHHWGSIIPEICNYGTKIKHLIRIDDALDLFANHALAGIVGLLFNGFFVTSAAISLDGVNTAIQGGFLDKNYKQLYIQFAYVLACCPHMCSWSRRRLQRSFLDWI